MPYILKIPADESPVDVDEMIRFFRENPWNPSQIRASVHELSWQKQMEKVVQGVENGTFKPEKRKYSSFDSCETHV